MFSVSQLILASVEAKTDTARARPSLQLIFRFHAVQCCHNKPPRVLELLRSVSSDSIKNSPDGRGSPIRLYAGRKALFTPAAQISLERSRLERPGSGHRKGVVGPRWTQLLHKQHYIIAAWPWTRPIYSTMKKKETLTRSDVLKFDTTERRTSSLCVQENPGQRPSRKTRSCTRNEGAGSSDPE